MFERFTERSRQVVVLAQDEARALKHNYIGTEHLLLGLLREEEGLAARVLDSFDVDLGEVRAQIALITGEGDAFHSGQIPFTPRAKKVLELGLREALSLGHNYIGTEHILLGLVRENGGVAARILLEFDADPETVRERISALLERPFASGAIPPPRPMRRAHEPWEYRVEHLVAADAGALQAELDGLGREGWQFVAVLPEGESRQWIFKRPVRRGRTAAPDRRSDLHKQTFEQLLDSMAAARETAGNAGETEKAEAIGTLETRFERVLRDSLGVLAGWEGEGIDVAALTRPELLRVLEAYASTTGELVDLLVSRKERAIDQQRFEPASACRELVRRLRTLVEEIQATTAP